MRSEHNLNPRPPERRKRWEGCWGSLLCCNSQKGKGGGKRIVPASRLPDNNNSTASAAAQANGPQPQAIAMAAPPSSPASISNPNSARPSAPQSPSCFVSANSPQGPSIFATGPYAHETQLVSPPAFSHFTTEPSTAPLTPRLDLAHLTSPSSPDVPFAQFLSASGLRSHISEKWDTAVSPNNGAHQDANFFCPATFAEFYVDQSSPFPHNGGRLSVSRDVEVTPATGKGQQQMKQITSPKQDQEEVEAYRASFGFSADEIVVSTHYVEITNVEEEDSFTIRPFRAHKSVMDASCDHQEQGTHKAQSDLGVRSSPKTQPNLADLERSHQKLTRSNYNQVDPIFPDEEDIISKWGSSKFRRNYELGLSSSDAEVDYGRRRGSRAAKVDISLCG